MKRQINKKTKKESIKLPQKRKISALKKNFTFAAVLEKMLVKQKYLNNK